MNGMHLFGENYMKVVSIIRDLPQYVRIVCSRRKLLNVPSSYDSCSALFQVPSPSQFFDEVDRLMVRAKSDQELFITSLPADSSTVSASGGGGYARGVDRFKSRSLEPLTSLAM